MFEILDKHDARECILTRGSGGDEGDLRYYRSQSRTYDCVIRIAAIFSFFNLCERSRYMNVVFPNIVARQSLGLSMSVLSCALRTARKSGNTAIRVHLA